MTQGYDTGPRHAATLHGYDKFCSKNDVVSGWSPFFQRPYIKMTTQFGAVVTFFLVIHTGFEPVTSSLSRKRSKPAELMDQ